MNILGIIKKIFFKDVKKYDLVNFSSIISIPSKSSIKNQDLLNKIDKQIYEYNSILNNSKILLSNDLTNNINDNIRLYSSLISNVFVHYNNNYTLENKVEMKYNICKIKMYYNLINGLYSDSYIKAIALNEIYKKRIFLSKNKKDAVKFAKDNLLNAIIVFRNQMSAINEEINSYVNFFEIPVSKDEDIIFNDLFDSYIYSKANDITKMCEAIGIKLEDISLEEVLIKEFYLQKYAYNKEKMNNLIDKLESLHLINTLFIYFDSLEILKNEALIFASYANTSENFNNLFSELLTIIAKQRFKNADFSNISKIEKDYYLKFLEEYINNIFKADYVYLILESEFKDTTKAIKYIKEYIKKDGIFDFEYILNNKDKLRFLYLISQKYGFITYIGNKIVKRKDYKKQVYFNEILFDWDDEVPLVSVFKMYEISALKYDKIEKDCLFNLYRLYTANHSSDVYKLPKGITKINSVNYLSEESEDFTNKLLKQLNNKNLFLPSSMKVFSGRIFDDKSLNSLVLNDGLEMVSVSALLASKGNELVFPSSLSVIFNDEMNDNFSNYFKDWNDSKLYTDSYLSRFESVIFKDYENSKLLFNRTELFDLIKETIVIKTNNSIKLKNTDINRNVFISSLKEIILLTNDKRYVINLENLFYEPLHLDNGNIISNYIKNYTASIIVDYIYDEIKNLEESNNKTLKK